MQALHPFASRISDENTALRTILEGTATTTGGRFFDALVTPIAIGPTNAATVVATPEPSSIALVALGLVRLFAARRNRI